LEISTQLVDIFNTRATKEKMSRSCLAERTFKRRFKKATGYSPIAYVQHLRVEEAKRRLERTATPIDEITWTVGNKDPAFFRRLFKRITLGAYRRKFRYYAPFMIQYPDCNS
jgi:transcriptional regulator GlxA family with amidase domain